MQSFEQLAFINGSRTGVINTSWGPVRIGVYSKHLEHWLKYFSLEQMLFVSGERLIVDPAAEMSRVQVNFSFFMDLLFNFETSKMGTGASKGAFI